MFTSAQTVNPDNGLEAYEGVFPWATYIEVLDNLTLNLRSECFGNIIAPDWVFVPAICLTSGYNTYRLHFGSVNFTNSEITMISTTVYIHTEYIHSRFYNGGLIKLPMSLEFTGTISSIDLPFNLDDEQFIGSIAYFIGRRNMVDSVTGASHTMTRYNTLEIISDEDCDSFGRVETQMCALGTDENARKAPCNALGHLAVYYNLKYVLIGGGGDDYCHYIIHPNFFPRMSLLLEWITEITGISE